MDISNLVTREASENGEWFQFEAYGKKWPFDLKILGKDSDAVQKYGRRSLQNSLVSKMGTGKYGDFTDEDYRELDEASTGSVIVRIAGIRGYRYEGKELAGKDEPVFLLGRELKNDGESYRYLVEQIPAVRDFVLEKSGARENFLPGRK